jgi:hypothetical protein
MYAPHRSDQKPEAERRSRFAPPRANTRRQQMLRWRLFFSVIVRDVRHFSRIGIAWIYRAPLTMI